MVQYASIERFSGDIVCEDRPSAMIRLVAETGGYMLGVVAKVGSCVATGWRRSRTNRRAWIRLVPFLKRSVIAESCGTDSDRTIWTFGTPLRPFSSGPGISSSIPDHRGPGP